MKNGKKQTENDDIFSLLAGTMDFFIDDMKEMDPEGYRDYIKEAEKMKRGLQELKIGRKNE